jgi:hypothetical protein
MRRLFSGSMIVAGTLAVVAMWSSARGPAAAQRNAAAYKAPRTADGEPDLNGIWQALNEANWDVEAHSARPSPFPELLGAYLAEPGGLSVVDGGKIPYKPEALVVKKERFERRLKPDPDNLKVVADMEAKCFAPPPPRGAYMPFPFQIVQNKNVVLFAYEFAGYPRLVFMGLPVKTEEFYAVDTWMGQSVGRWEGETLVVESRNFLGPVWLDRVGNFISEKAVVVERYTRTSADHLAYDATITDPDTFTRPWKLQMALYRRVDRNAQLLEFECVPFVEPFLYGALESKPLKRKSP